MKKISLKTLLVTIIVVGASVFLTGCQKTTQSPFVVTDDAKDITNASETQSMYKTDMSLDEVLNFYREKLTTNNLTERELLTIKSDTTLNLVFDGSENGKAMVIQAVVFDNYTNVTVRFEDV